MQTHFKVVRMSYVSPKVVNVCDLGQFPTHPDFPEKPDWSALLGPFLPEGEPHTHGF